MAKKREDRDAYGRLIVNGWHLEVSDAEFDPSTGELKYVRIYGCNHKGSVFGKTMGQRLHVRSEDNERHDQP